MKNIILCGFMGSGKTTVGRELAAQLGMTYVDMDEWIESRAGMAVSEIFRTQGEPVFRRYESEAARAFSKQTGLVISTGGGAVLNEQNVRAFREGGIILLLDVPLDIIRSRLEGDTTRPLLNKPDKDAAMHSLYSARMPVYRSAADITAVNADNRPAKEFAGQLAEKLALMIQTPL